MYDEEKFTQAWKSCAEIYNAVLGQSNDALKEAFFHLRNVRVGDSPDGAKSVQEFFKTAHDRTIPLAKLTAALKFGLNDGYENTDAPPRPESPRKEQPRGPYEIVPMSELLERRSTQSWLIKNALPASGVSVLFGASQSGKTFVVLDMAAHVLLGLPWCGLQTARGRVLIIALDGQSGLPERLKALKLKHDIPDDAPLGFLTGPLSLRPLPRGLVDEVKSFNPDWIIIDTLSRAMGDGDENLAKDMNELIKKVEYVASSCRAHVTLVHHTGHENKERERGNSTLRANVETSIAVLRDEHSRRIVFKKVRDAEAGREIGFELVRVELGRDDDGDEIASCTVRYHDAPPREKFGPRGQAREALSHLERAIHDVGKAAPEGITGVPEGHTCVTKELWKKYCDMGGFAGGREDAGSSQKNRFGTAFKRAHDTLLKNGSIAEAKDTSSGEFWVWISA